MDRHEGDEAFQQAAAAARREAALRGCGDWFRKEVSAMSKTMEPYLMSVLSSRLYSIGLEMTNTLMRTARS